MAKEVVAEAFGHGKLESQTKAGFHEQISVKTRRAERGVEEA